MPHIASFIPILMLVVDIVNVRLNKNTFEPNSGTTGCLQFMSIFRPESNGAPLAIINADDNLPNCEDKGFSLSLYVSKLLLKNKFMSKLPTLSLPVLAYIIIFTFCPGYTGPFGIYIYPPTLL